MKQSKEEVILKLADYRLYQNAVAVYDMYFISICLHWTGISNLSELTLNLLNPAELTIQMLDIFDITEGELKLIIGGKVICWVHDSSRVR